MRIWRDFYTNQDRRIALNKTSIVSLFPVEPSSLRRPAVGVLTSTGVIYEVVESFENLFAWLSETE
jgi:hypothetical protein